MGLFDFAKQKRVTWNEKTEAAWIHCIKDLATEQDYVSVLGLGKTCFEGLMTVVFPIACCEAQESQKLETISFHEQLLRASTNCQMQTNTFNKLKLIYCTGKAVQKPNACRYGSRQV